jgi:hypothetical protein
MHVFHCASQPPPAEMEQFAQVSQLPELSQVPPPPEELDAVVKPPDELDDVTPPPELDDVTPPPELDDDVVKPPEELDDPVVKPPDELDGFAPPAPPRPPLLVVTTPVLLELPWPTVVCQSESPPAPPAPAPVAAFLPQANGTSASGINDQTASKRMDCMKPPASPKDKTPLRNPGRARMFA